MPRLYNGPVITMLETYLGQTVRHADTMPDPVCEDVTAIRAYTLDGTFTDFIMHGTVADVHWLNEVEFWSWPPISH